MVTQVDEEVKVTDLSLPPVDEVEDLLDDARDVIVKYNAGDSGCLVWALHGGEIFTDIKALLLGTFKAKASKLDGISYKTISWWLKLWKYRDALKAYCKSNGLKYDLEAGEIELSQETALKVVNDHVKSLPETEKQRRDRKRRERRQGPKPEKKKPVVLKFPEINPETTKEAVLKVLKEGAECLDDLRSKDVNEAAVLANEVVACMERVPVPFTQTPDGDMPTGEGDSEAATPPQKEPEPANLWERSRRIMDLLYVSREQFEEETGHALAMQKHIPEQILLAEQYLKQWRFRFKLDQTPPPAPMTPVKTEEEIAAEEKEIDRLQAEQHFAVGEMAYVFDTTYHMKAFQQVEIVRPSINDVIGEYHMVRMVRGDGKKPRSKRAKPYTKELAQRKWRLEVERSRREAWTKLESLTESLGEGPTDESLDAYIE